MIHLYLLRFGLMRRVGRFVADSNNYRRGDTVVVHSGRGTELAEVLLPMPLAPFESPSVRILRKASAEDQARAAWAEAERPRRFEQCDRLFRDGVWPLELIDVEPMLDDRRTVLHYLGPHGLDISGLRDAVQAVCDLDIVLEPVGLDAPAEADPDFEPASACGSCGSGGGGRSDSSEHACSSCSGCSLQALLANAKPR